LDFQAVFQGLAWFFKGGSGLSRIGVGFSWAGSDRFSQVAYII
jgi:hypothetical protein